MRAHAKLKGLFSRLRINRGRTPRSRDAAYIVEFRIPSQSVGTYQEDAAYPPRLNRVFWPGD
jgi:hypothetical protein